jgi:hypothetical protein
MPECVRPASFRCLVRLGNLHNSTTDNWQLFKFFEPFCGSVSALLRFTKVLVLLGLQGFFLLFHCFFFCFVCCSLFVVLFSVRTVSSYAFACLIFPHLVFCSSHLEFSSFMRFVWLVFTILVGVEGLNCTNGLEFATTSVRHFVARFVRNGTFNSVAWVDFSATYWNTFVSLSLLADATEVGVMTVEDLESFVSQLVLQFDGSGWQSNYFDDMDWAIEALVKTAAQVRSASLQATLLNRAVRLSLVVEKAWDTTCCGETPGGYWWSVDMKYKACASNMGTATALCRLARANNNATLLHLAQEAFSFWTQKFVATSGQAMDGITNLGNESWNVYTYNQGEIRNGEKVLSLFDNRDAHWSCCLFG